MGAQSLLTGRRIAAFLLIACAAVFAVGRMLLTGRVVWKWPAGQTDAYLRWERGFVILAVLVTALGLVVLEDLLRAAGESVISRLALVPYSFGAVVVVVSETSYLHNRERTPGRVLRGPGAAGAGDVRRGAAPDRAGGRAGAWLGSAPSFDGPKLRRGRCLNSLQSRGQTCPMICRIVPRLAGRAPGRTWHGS
jgi:hypothetical protein